MEGIPNDVLEMNDAALVAGLEDDILELINRGKPPFGVNGQLELNGRGGGDGRLAEAAGGHLPVLLFDRVDDIDGRQILRGELVGIEPNAHAVIAGPEKRHVTDSFDARQIVLDAERREVAEVKLVIVIVAVRLLSRYQVHAQEDARRLLFG